MELTINQLEEIKKILNEYNNKTIYQLEADAVVNIINELPSENKKENAEKNWIFDSELSGCSIFFDKLLDYASGVIVDNFKKNMTISFGKVDTKLTVLTTRLLKVVYGDKLLEGENKDSIEIETKDGRLGELINTKLAETDYCVADIILGDSSKDIIKLFNAIKDADEAYHSDAKNKNVTNKEYFELINSIRTPYAVVHKEYNSLSFLEKWCTPTGWALRGSMNKAKDLVNDYYNALSKENDKNIKNNEVKYINEEDKKYITDNNIDLNTLPSSRNTLKISETLIGLAKTSRVQITVDEEYDVNLASKDNMANFNERQYLEKEEIVDLD